MMSTTYVRPAEQQGQKVRIPAAAKPFMEWADTEQMTCRQVAVLKLVEANPGLTVGAIAYALGVPKPTVTRAADKLAALGLLHRGVDEYDRRLMLLWPGKE